MEKSKQVINEHLLGAGGALFIIIVKYFTLRLHPNEPIYLLGPRRIIDPTFLQNDWTWGSSSLFTENIRILYDCLIAPLWIFFDPLIVALIGRLIVWLLLIFSMIILIKTLRIKWWQFIFGFLCWIYWEFGQGFPSGAWVFGGLESKCFSYAFLFLSLNSLLNKRYILGGIFSGISTSFHIIVGGWGFIALLGALLVKYKDYGFKNILKFCFFSFLLCLPVTVIAIYYLKTGAINNVPIASKEIIDTLSIYFRNPHHLDPNWFLNWKKSVFIVVIFLLTNIILFKAFCREKAVFLVSFLSALLGIFLCGIIARMLDVSWFLKFYPFRLFPVFLMAFFCLTFPVFLFDNITAKGNKINMVIIKDLNHLAVMIILCYSISFLPHFMKDIISFPKKWYHDIVYYEKNNFNKATHWIKQNTDKNSIFIAPPYLSTFWLFAERAQVVSFKCAAANIRIVEWYERIVALNGGNEFKGVGFKVYPELKHNYSKLNRNQLSSIMQVYGANYYFVEKERKELNDLLVYSNDEYYLYDLSKSKEIG